MNESISQFWQSIPELAQQIIIGVIASAIWTMPSYFITNLLMARFQKQRKNQDDKLKMHFEELRKEVTTLITFSNGLTKKYGEIVFDQHLPQPSDSIEAHFPEEAVEFAKYQTKIDAHNRSYEEFKLKIREYFKSKGFDVGPDIPNKQSPYIYADIFSPLFEWWRSCSHQQDNPWPDFNNILTKIDLGPNNLYAAGWEGNAIAYAKTERDIKNCKQVIYEVAKNMENEREAVNILDSADSLITQIRSFAQRLKRKLDDVDNYWPGTKSYKFKEEKKKCPRCKEVFG